MTTRKLNFGCGTRFSDSWVNIDFDSYDSRVQRVNLLSGFPFADSSFDAVYSSHVLEHFDPDQGRFLLSESFRVLTKGGVLRIVVPDLEGSCREYLRVLSMEPGDEKHQLYSWIIIEMLDQLVRNKPSGQMGPFWDALTNDGGLEMKAYIMARTQNNVFDSPPKLSFLDKLKRVTPNKLYTKLTYTYLHFISLLLPKSLRELVFVQTTIGERHRWMYDRFSMTKLFQDAGFSRVQVVSHNTSDIPGFEFSELDCLASGSPYKNNSIYMEGTK